MNFSDPMAVTLLATTILSSAASIILWSAVRTSRARYDTLHETLDTLTTERDTASRERSEALQAKTEATTRLEEAHSRITSLQTERDDAVTAREEAQQESSAARQHTALMKQQLESESERRKDWEQQQSEFLKTSKDAVFKLSQDISSKLIEDHKREQSSERKERERFTKEWSEGLHKEFKSVSDVIATMSKDVETQGASVSTLWKALSTPGEAGRFSEIGLENSLKALGLEPGQDFVMQYAIRDAAGKASLRPDAIIFLPGSRVMVIDSKASKFLLELAEADGTDDEPQALANLQRSMREHIKLLGGKDYKNAVLRAYRDAGRGDQVGHIMLIMYVPNDAALEHVKRADAEFELRCQQADIIPASATGLKAFLSACRYDIGMARQAENQQKIVEGVEELLASLSVVLSHATSVGKGLKSASDHFVKFSSSINKRLLPKSRKLMSMGVTPTTNKALPDRIPSYSVHEESAVIEGESEEVGTRKVVSLKKEDKRQSEEA